MKIPAILKDRNFFLLWLANGISTLGDNVTSLTLIILVNALTHSLTAISILVISIALPKIIFGLFAGVYVDRWNRKYIMLASDFVRAILVLGFIPAAFLGNLWLIYMLAFLQAAVGTFFDPARGALVQSIVPEEQFMEANSITQTIAVIAQFAGATLAGLLVGLTGQYTPAFIVDALTFIASVGLVLCVHAKHIRAVAGAASQHFLHALQEGIQTVLQSRILLALMITFTMMMFAVAPIQVLFVPLIVNTLHLSTTWIGIIQGGDTVGNIVAAALLVGVATKIKPTPLFVGSVFGIAVAIAAMAVAYNFSSLILSMFVFGLVTITFQTSYTTVMQQIVSNEVMGRVMSLLEILPGAVSVVSLAIVGVLGAILGIRQTFLLAAVLMAFTGVYAWFAFRRVNKETASENG